MKYSSRHAPRDVRMSFLAPGNPRFKAKLGLITRSVMATLALVILSRQLHNFSGCGAIPHRVHAGTLVTEATR
jgi:hypothetical protein